MTKRKKPEDLLKRGRPTDYTADLAAIICGKIATGKTLADICDEEEMPSTTSVTKWQMDFPEFAIAYARARMNQADVFADRIIRIAEEMIKIADENEEDWVFNEEKKRFEPNHDVVQRSRLRVEARTKMIDHLKWTAAKLKPQSYGERLEAHLTGQIDQRNLNVNIDASSLTPAARAALRLALQPKIDALGAPAAADEEETE